MVISRIPKDGRPVAMLPRVVALSTRSAGYKAAQAFRGHPSPHSTLNQTITSVCTTMSSIRKRHQLPKAPSIPTKPEMEAITEDYRKRIRYAEVLEGYMFRITRRWFQQMEKKPLLTQQEQSDLDWLALEQKEADRRYVNLTSLPFKELPPSSSHHFYMANTLPPELVELILDEVSPRNQDVASLLSLSLVSKSFTASCQQRLWSDTNLFSDGEAASETGAVHDKSLLMARTVTSSPHLGAYIRRLNYEVLSTTNDYDLIRLASALSEMPNVVELTLRCGAKGSTEAASFLFFPKRWSSGVVAVVNSSANLRKLSLARFSDVPLDILKVVIRGLEALELSQMTFASQRHEECDSLSQGSAPALKALMCDLGSYDSAYGRLVNSTRYTQILSAITNVESLDLCVRGVDWRRQGPLRHAHRLRNMNLHLDVPSLNGVVNLPSNTILENLHSSSYATLTHLKVTLTHTSNLSLTISPLIGLSLDTLPNLRSLKVVQVDLTLDLSGPTNPDSQLSQVMLLWGDPSRPRASWDRFDEALSGIHTLKKVEINIFIDISTRPELRAMAERIRRNLTRIHPAGFPHLLRRRNAGRVEFGLSVNDF
ncbi:hypothetical protein NMY22_g17974 [Coprinellus aureogranulatus]|nr:hypothetical protein NMY22_g17974 [Coprinellus aureogranulatus]